MLTHQSTDFGAGLSLQRPWALLTTSRSLQQARARRVVRRFGLVPVPVRTGAGLKLDVKAVKLALIDLREDPRTATQLLVTLATLANRPSVVLLVSGPEQLWIGARFGVPTSEARSDRELFEAIANSLELGATLRRPQ